MNAAVELTCNCGEIVKGKTDSSAIFFVAAKLNHTICRNDHIKDLDGLITHFPKCLD